MKKIFRTNKGRKIAGVCAGLGEVFNLDPVVLRVLFLVFIPFGGIGLLTYIIMWMAVPIKEQEEDGGKPAQRLYLSTENKKIAGVCGGLGELFDLDPTIFRVGFLVLIFVGGSGVLLYIILWLIVPKRGDQNEDIPKLPE